MPVFLDHAATTPVLPEVSQYYQSILQAPQNASSVHSLGQRARATLEEARAELAALLGVKADHLVFTSGSTEANNLAIRGFVDGRFAAGIPTRIACAAIEHSSVRETVARVARNPGVEWMRLPVNEGGEASPFQVTADLLCMMAVQNETGIQQPLSAARDWRAQGTGRWLCDLTQGFALLTPGQYAGADFYSIASHKIYGPGGVGALAGPGVPNLRAQITGGPQERELRAGTEPVALIRAFVYAAKKCAEKREASTEHLKKLCSAFMTRLSEEKISLRENGNPAKRLPGFLNLSLTGVAAADLVIALDAKGFCISAGSACATGVMEVSPVLAAMYPNDPQRAAEGVRITPGAQTTTQEMLAAADAVVACVRRSRP